MPTKSERVLGMLLGFASGDSLGAPYAGLPIKSEAAERVSGFTANPSHPYLGHLKPGWFTENTELLLDSSLDYARDRGFVFEHRKRSIVAWSRRVAADPEARWPGATTLSGARLLERGGGQAAPKNPSAGALYRCLPIAVVAEGRAGLDMVEREVRLTHSSDESVVGGHIVFLIASAILRGVEPREAAARAVTQLGEECVNCEVVDLVRSAIGWKDTRSLPKAFGTGALIRETVPVAVAVTIAVEGLRDAVLCAANMRKQSQGPWDRATADENGGNSDGIAALVGAFRGGYAGSAEILKLGPGLDQVDRIALAAEALSRAADR